MWEGEGGGPNDGFGSLEDGLAGCEAPNPILRIREV
jgi:hypothetical protein